MFYKKKVSGKHGNGNGKQMETLKVHLQRSSMGKKSQHSRRSYHSLHKNKCEVLHIGNKQKKINCTDILRGNTCLDNDFHEKDFEETENG